MSDAFTPHVGSYVVDRDGYLADLRHALTQQRRVQERMLGEAEAAHAASPTPLTSERLASFRAAVDRLREASEYALRRVPDPLGVALELVSDGTFRMAIESPAGTATGRGTWTVESEMVVLVHLEEGDRALDAPVTEALRIKGGALEKRATDDHFPFFLRRLAPPGS